MIAVYSRMAQNDLMDIVRHCDASVPGLGKEFIAEFDTLLAQCCENPEIGVCLEAPYRILEMNRFPYNIIYRIGNNEVHVIAVAHQHRIEEIKPCYIGEPPVSWPVSKSAFTDSRDRHTACVPGTRW